MKVLITGPDGVLGSNLVRELLSRNYEVSVFLLKGTKAKTLDGLNIKRFYGDILDVSSLNPAFQHQDIVFHCAAATSVFPPRDEFVNKVNIEGTKNIIQATLQHQIKRLICVGTANSFTFGTSKNELGVEDTPFVSKKYGLDYMDSKRKAQELLLDAAKHQNLPAIIVNPTFMIGPYDSKPSSGQMLLALNKGKVPCYTSGGKNYIAVKDVAVAMVNAIEMGKIGECYILGNENLSYQEAFSKLAEAIGSKAPQVKFPNTIIKTYGTLNSLFAKWFRYAPSVTKELAIISCENHYYSSEKAQKELKLPQTPIEIAAKESFEWFKKNGYV